MLGSDFYKDLAASALDVAQAAMAVIEYQLPRSVLSKLHQAKKRACDPFDDTKHWYLGLSQEEQAPFVVHLLDDLVQLSYAVAKLRTVVAEAPTTDPSSLNLQLARQRRVA